MERIGYLLEQAARELRRLLDENLRAEGLTFSRIVLLGYLDWKMGRGEVCSQTDICRECGNTRPPSVTSLLQALEKEGLIVREAGRDARVKSVFLTRKGEELAARCRDFVSRAEEVMTEGMSEEELCVFQRCLLLAAENLEKFSADPDRKGEFL